MTFSRKLNQGPYLLMLPLTASKSLARKPVKFCNMTKPVAAAQGKTKVTRSSIAPELNVKSARRLVELIALADISNEGVFTLEGTALAEALAIVDEHKASAEARETYRLSQPIPTTEIRGRTLYVMFDGKDIGRATIYRGKTVWLDMGDKTIAASQSKAVAHFVRQYKLQQQENHDANN